MFAIGIIVSQAVIAVEKQQQLKLGKRRTWVTVDQASVAVPIPEVIVNEFFSARNTA